MNYSDKLNGFWEEGYHYYVEIRDDRMTVLDYRRKPALEANIQYDAQRLESGLETEIFLSDNVLSRDAYGEMMTMIRSLTYKDGRLELLYYYTIMGEKLYTLRKVDRGPFDHILIHDEKMLKKLEGKWIQVRNGADSGNSLIFSGNRMKYLLSSCAIIDENVHVCSLVTSPDDMFITPEDLSRRDFGPITQIKISGEVLTSHMMILDAPSPGLVFVRKDRFKA